MSPLLWKITILIFLFLMVVAVKSAEPPKADPSLEKIKAQLGKLQQNIKDLAGILWTESSVWLKSLGKKVCDASVKLFGKAPEFCASLKAFDT